MFGWFRRKKEMEDIKNEVRGSFSHVKEDINSLTKWVKHLDNTDDGLKQDISDIRETLSTMQTDLEGLKNTFALLNVSKMRGLSKQLTKFEVKQTAVEGVGEAVETAVETGEMSNFLELLTVMEKAIIYILANTDMKLSYEDIAAMLGKQRSTVRSQINQIRQKIPGIVDEEIEKNGKKRVFMPERVKNRVLRGIKQAKKRKSES